MFRFLISLGVAIAIPVGVWNPQRPDDEGVWDIWADDREIKVNCEEYRVGSISNLENQFSESTCRAVCNEICGNPRTLNQLALCLGRMQMLQCEFAYTSLETLPLDRHWCIHPETNRIHVFLDDPAVIEYARSANQASLYFDIDYTLDESCLSGASISMEYGFPTWLAETWPTLDESLLCPLSGNSAVYRVAPDVGYGARITRSASDHRILFKLEKEHIGWFNSHGGQVHLDIAFQACQTGLLNPPPMTQNSWLGLVVEVSNEPVSVRALYDRASDTDFWGWKGPFLKW